MNKAITLKQPWASLAVMGLKTIETRSWNTKHRGTTVIHASANFSKEDKDLCKEWPFNIYIKDVEALPLGCIIGTVTVTRTETTSEAIVEITETDPDGALRESAFGNFKPGRFAWHLADPIQFSKPIPAKGALSLWKCSAEQIGKILRILDVDLSKKQFEQVKF